MNKSKNSTQSTPKIASLALAIDFSCVDGLVKSVETFIESDAFKRLSEPSRNFIIKALTTSGNGLLNICIRVPRTPTSAGKLTAECDLVGLLELLAVALYKFECNSGLEITDETPWL
ncbi:hypothetical protein EYR97_15405 [Alteromonas sp. KUL42]|uniref:hypothetical protein n=1 Tax=Alteromonas sp. KUL42 TaxID=2480797 RepID=UPI001036B3EA|nr:hypothetical protein [Alteromonas sp. KUL42]TAP33288.1 hypothetical protein EYR97_15405 [Alteromonas sp. KUL42]